MNRWDYLGMITKNWYVGNKVSDDPEMLVKVGNTVNFGEIADALNAMAWSVHVANSISSANNALNEYKVTYDDGSTAIVRAGNELGAIAAANAVTGSYQPSLTLSGPSSTAVVSNTDSGSTTEGTLLGFVAPGTLPSVGPASGAAALEAGAGEGLIASATRLVGGAVAFLLTPNTANAPSPQQINFDASLQADSTFYLFHYAQPETVTSILNSGLYSADSSVGRWGTFATDNPMYTPSGAQQSLALPAPVPPTVVIPIRVEPGDAFWGPMPVAPTINPPRTGGGGNKRRQVLTLDKSNLDQRRVRSEPHKPTKARKLSQRSPMIND
ncbi:hypothetical protein MASR2M8_14020 [Opitutaceae bacterium]